MHKYPKHFTIVNPNQIDSVLSIKSTAELEEQIKKELQMEHTFGSPSGVLPVSPAAPQEK